MKSKEIKPPHFIVGNLLKIIRDRGITQETLSEYAGTAPSQMSKILKGNVQLNFWQLSNIATCLKMREIDIITYPYIYEKVAGGRTHRILLEFDVSEEELEKINLKDKMKNKYNL